MPFENCTHLTSITIPDSVTHIWSWAFVGGTSLESIDVDPGNEDFLGVEGVLIGGSTLIRCPEKMSSSFAIPHGVTSIVGGTSSGFPDAIPLPSGEGALKAAAL